MEAIVNGKADAWRRRIDDQRASGQSVRAWCEANDAQEGSFYWWRARLGLSPGKRRLRRSLKSAEAKPTPLAFAQVVVHRERYLNPIFFLWRRPDRLSG